MIGTDIFAGAPSGTPLRIAVPNKGSLSASAIEILRKCGYR